MPAPSSRGARFDSERFEQLVGGIWLQNAGSLLLLLGSFFLILWGYTQGKIGPEILIAAGVAFGGVLAWRGDLIARTIRPLGYALLGVGLGVVYITLYLGHFRMGVLSSGVTFVLLALLSFLTVDLGMRRQQAAVASLGLAGAFIPLLLKSLSGPGFSLSPPVLLGYFAVVNAVVFALASARGWSGLVLMSLVFTSMTWIMHTMGSVWGFSVQLGMSALFTALGLAPVVRLARTQSPVRGVDLAVVSAAPMLLLVATASYLTAERGITTGGLLAGLGSVNLIAALWVDARRSTRDLWRPLTAAATIFVAAALERVLASDYLTLAWCVEGAALVWLGFAPRAGWLRGLGYGVSCLVFLRLLYTPGSYDPAAGGGIGMFNGTALRDLLCIAAFAAIADRMLRKRDLLSDIEAYFPLIWLAAVNALFMAWTYREAPNIVRWISGPVYIVGPGHPPLYNPARAADVTLIVATAWAAQSFLLMFLAPVRRSPFHRYVAYGVAVFGFVPFLRAVSGDHYWRAADTPVLYPAGLLMLFCVAAMMAMASFLWNRRADLGKYETRTPEITLIAASLALLLLSAREAGHAAIAFRVGAEPDETTAMLAAGITSAAWVLQAGALLAVGWARGSAFLRWTGLGLVGLTLLKVALFDLQRVDIFWRFVIALGVGTVLLVFSFVYQRRSRTAKAD